MGIVGARNVVLAVLFICAIGDQAIALDWSKMPGLDAQKLKADQKKKIEEILAKLKNTRGCEGSLADCYSQGDMTAKRHAGYVARMVRKGKEFKDIEKGIELRNQSAFPSEKYKANLSGHPHLGNPEAKVVLVEYACFECPFCAHLAPKIKNLVKKYGGKVVYYYKFFPVRSHPRGVAAALAGFAAHKQGKFWPMYDLLFENRTDLEDEDLLSYARRAGLDTKEFLVDVKSKGAMKFVEKDKLEGMRFGVEGTPTFFINGKEFKGLQDYAEIVDRIEEELDIVAGAIQ